MSRGINLFLLNAIQRIIKATANLTVEVKDKKISCGFAVFS